MNANTNTQNSSDKNPPSATLSAYKSSSSSSFASVSSSSSQESLHEKTLSSSLNSTEVPMRWKEGLPPFVPGKI